MAASLNQGAARSRGSRTQHIFDCLLCFDSHNAISPDSWVKNSSIHVLFMAI